METLSFEQLKDRISRIYEKGHFIFFDYDPKEMFVKFDNPIEFYTFLIDYLNLERWFFTVYKSPFTRSIYVSGGWHV